jgi:hypothetical protein
MVIAERRNTNSCYRRGGTVRKLFSFGFESDTNGRVMK